MRGTGKTWGRSRTTIILAYTQKVPRSGGVRKYTYPLSYDPSGSTRVEQFDMDVQVRGHDKSFGVRSRGYEFESGAAEDAKQLTMRARSFVRPVTSPSSTRWRKTIGR